MITESGPVEIAVPRDRGGSFEPQLVKKRQWRLGGVDEMVLSLDGELASAEPKKLRYRLLHVAACLTRGGRRLRLRISATWPWRNELATAFHRLAALPRPAG